MKPAFFVLILAVLANPAAAERPWWVEGSFASIELHQLTVKLKPAETPTQRLPSVLTLIKEAATNHRIDPDLLRALVAQESAYDPGAVSEDGAVGLGQLMPIIANWCGVRNRFHRIENINCSARHLRFLLTKYKGDERLALAAYNAGEPAVDRCACVPNYPETQNYVARIMLLRRTRFNDLEGGTDAE
jgi:soluble lytic murein transglycosylase-like protein